MIEAALVSCDDHLDLNMLPADVWQTRMAAKWGERTPRIEMPEQGPAMWVADGERWGFWSGKNGNPFGRSTPPTTAAGSRTPANCAQVIRSCGCRTWTATMSGATWYSGRSPR